MNQKGFAPILIIVGTLVLSGLIVGGAYVYKSKVMHKNIILNTQNQVKSTAAPNITQNQDETTGWRTYTDSAQTYSLRYPKQLFPNTCGDGAFAIEQLHDCGSERVWLITVTELDPEQLKWLQDVSVYSSISEKEVSINGSKYTQYKGIVNQENWNGPGIYYAKTWVIVPHNNKTYGLAYTKENEKDTDYSEIFDQILSTFKFN